MGIRKTLRDKLRGYATTEWLKKNGAIVGEDVELIGFVCSKNDATCLEIGNHVTCVGTHILTHDASTKRFLTEYNNIVRLGRVVIGDNVFIGLGSIILPNVKIGNNVAIGAGSVVTHDIPDNSVAVGNPCRVIETIEEFKKKNLDRINEDNLIYNVGRAKLSEDELKKLNEKMDGRMLYAARRNNGE